MLIKFSIALASSKSSSLCWKLKCSLISSMWWTSTSYSSLSFIAASGRHFTFGAPFPSQVPRGLFYSWGEPSNLLLFFCPFSQEISVTHSLTWSYWLVLYLWFVGAWRTYSMALFSIWVDWPQHRSYLVFKSILSHAHLKHERCLHCK